MRPFIKFLILTTPCVLGISLCPVLVAGSYSSQARRSGNNFSSGYYPTPPDPYAAERYRIAEEELREQLKKASSDGEAQLARDQVEAWKNFVPEDPCRKIGDQQFYAKGHGWVKFGGKIIEKKAGGIIVEGAFRSLDDPFQLHLYKGKFFVARFPYVSTNDTQVLCVESYSDFTAYRSSSNTVVGVADMPNLDYGAVMSPPPPSAEMIDYAVKAAENQIATESSTLKWNQEQADKGDMFGQLRMGERYLNGEGVEKSISAAREYLQKAAAQGSSEASNRLANLKH